MSDDDQQPRWRKVEATPAGPAINRRRQFVIVCMTLLLLPAIGAGWYFHRSTFSQPPVLIGVAGNLNIVRFEGVYFAIPHGRGVDWARDDVRGAEGIVWAKSEAELGRLIAQKALTPKAQSNPLPGAPLPVSPEEFPVLIKVVEGFNIVRFKGLFYAVPHGLVVDWTKDDLARLPGIRIAPGEEAVTALVPK